MPSLGSGLSLGTISQISGFDFDASSYILSNSISNSVATNVFGVPNILRSNVEFNSAYDWNTSLCTKTSNYGTNPFGTANNSTLIANINSSFGRIFRHSPVAGTIKNNTSYVMSVYAKAGASNFLGMRFTGDMISAGSLYLTYNLASGTITSITPTAGTLHSSGMTDIGNGWYRCFFRFTTASSVSSTICDLACVTSTGNSEPASTAGTSSVEIYGAQIEESTSSTPSTFVLNEGDVNLSYLAPQGSKIVEYVNPQALINEFTLFLKQNNYWNKFVGWFTREGFNKPMVANVVIPSFGGLTSSPATAVSNLGNVKNDIGIFFDGNFQRASTTITNYDFTSSGHTLGVVGAFPTSGTRGGFFGENNAQAQHLFWLNPGTSFGGEYRFRDSWVTTSDNFRVGPRFHALTAKVGSPTRAFFDGGLIGTATTNASSLTSTALSNGTSNQLQLGRAAGAFNGTLSMCFILGTELTTTELTNFYTKLKNTICKNLLF